MTKNEALAAATASEQTRRLWDTLTSARNVCTAARDHYNKVEADFNETRRAIYDSTLAKLEAE
jgi:hypothetical protein